MHDPLIRGLASNGKVKIAATRGPGSSWLGSASQAGAFSGFQYLTVPLSRSRDLLILQAGRRLTEVPPPLVAKAEELGRDAGKAAADWVFDGNTPEEEYQRVLRGIEDGDPAVLGATEPTAIGPRTGYDQDDLARDLGTEPGDRALPRAVSAYAGAFWQETERAARHHAG